MRTKAQRERDRRAFQYNGSTSGKFKHDDYVRSRGCLVRGSGECEGPVQAAHLIHARGMGGRNGDWSGQGGLCRKHHSDAGPTPTMGMYEGSIREAFELEHRVDLAGEATRLTDQHLAEYGLTRDDLVDGLVPV